MNSFVSARLLPVLLLLVSEGGRFRHAHAFYSNTRQSVLPKPHGKECQRQPEQGFPGVSRKTERSNLSSSAKPNDAGDQAPQEPPPIIDIELPPEDGETETTTNSAGAPEGFDPIPASGGEGSPPEESEPLAAAPSAEADPLDDLDAAIAAARAPPAGIKINDPLSRGTESRSLINGDVVSSGPARAKRPATGGMFRAGSRDGMSFEAPPPPPPTRRKVVQMARKKEPAPSTFRSSELSDMNFEAKPMDSAPKKQRVVRMAQKEEPAPSTFRQSDLSDMSFEAKLEALTKTRLVQMEQKEQQGTKKTTPVASSMFQPRDFRSNSGTTSDGMTFDYQAPSPKKQRIVKMAEAQEPAPSTFSSAGGSDMSFEAKKDVAPPTKRRVVRMAEKEEYSPSTFESTTSEMSFEPKAEIIPPTRKRVVQMAEKKEFAPSTFESTTNEMSFEAKAEILPPTKKRTVQMAEKKAFAPSTFESRGSDISFEARPDVLPPKKQRIVSMAETVASPPAPSTEETKSTEAEAESQQIVPPTTERFAQQAKQNESASLAYESIGSKMFEARVAEPSPAQDIPGATDKEEPAPPTGDSEPLAETQPVAPDAPKKPRIVQKAENKEPAPSTFRKSDLSDMSFEAKPMPSDASKKKRIGTMTEKAQPAPSTFKNDESGMMYEAAPGLMFEAAIVETTKPSAPAEEKKNEIEPPQVAPEETSPLAQQDEEERKPEPDEAPTSVASPPQDEETVQVESAATPFKTEEEEEPLVEPKATTAPPEQEYEPAPGLMFEAKVEEAETPATPSPSLEREETLQPVVQKAPTPTPEKEEKAEPLIVPEEIEEMKKKEISGPEQPTVVESATAGTSLETETEVVNNPPKKRVVPPSTTSMFRSVTPATDKPPPSRTMFQSKQPVKDEAPPSRTMFQIRKPFKETPAPSRTMFEHKKSDEEKPPPSKTMFTNKTPEKEKPPPSKTMFANRIPEKEKPPPSRTMFERKTSAKEKPPPSTAMFRRKVSESSFDTRAEASVVTAPSNSSESTESTTAELTESEGAQQQVEPKSAVKSEDSPPTKVPRSDNVETSFETKKSPPTEEKAVRSPEEKESPSSSKAIQSKNNDMSFEVKKPAPKEQVKRIVKMAEKNEAPPSKLFQSDDSGMMFEARRRSAPSTVQGGSMFGARTTKPAANKLEPFKNLVKGSGALISSMFRPRTTAGPSAEEREKASLAEAARQQEKARVAEQMRLAEQRRLEEEARQKEARVAEQIRLAEQERVQEEARLAQEARLSEAEKARLAKVAEEIRLAEEHKMAQEAQLDKKARLDALVDEEEKKLTETAQLVEEARENEEKKGLFEDARAAEQKRETPRVAKASQLAEDVQEKTPMIKVPRTASSKKIKRKDTGIGVEISLGSPPARRLVKMTEKKDLPLQKAVRGTESSKPREIIQNISKTPEKKVAPSPKAFQGSNDSMSFTVQPARTRVVKASERKEVAVSESNPSNGSKAKVTDANNSALFQRGSKKATFDSDGSQFVYQSTKEKRLFLAQKVAAQMFKAQESAPATLESSDDGMNMVITGRKPTRKVRKATDDSISGNRSNTDGDLASKNLPQDIPGNSDNDSMKMASFIANNLSKQAPAFGSIQQSKMDVGSAKIATTDVQKFAKFVSDGLQMVNAESQKKKKVVTLEEARRERKERKRKKIFGFEIGPSEEEIAAQLMEGGKHLAVEGGKQLAKFTSDGLNMVYRAAEKQTKEYISSSVVKSAKSKDSSHAKKNKHVSNEVNPALFFATSDDTSMKKKAETQKSSAVAPSESSSAAHGGKKGENDAKTKKASSAIDTPKPFFAVSTSENNAPKTEKAFKESVSSSHVSVSIGQNTEEPIKDASTSSLLRSGGRMFVKFVGDGLQMVQKVATTKEKQYRRPRK